MLLAAPMVQAHPVAFEGSIGIMGDHSEDLNHSQLNYSFRHWLAFGVHHFTRASLDDSHATVATANLLLKRWNGKAYQGNLYALIGGGQSELSGKSEGALFTAVQFDIEDRKYYFLTRHTRLAADDAEDLVMSQVRLGFAPYVGDFEDLHTWLILEYAHKEFRSNERAEDLTPFIRLFYSNVMIEIGQSFDGESKFRYIIHY